MTAGKCLLDKQLREAGSRNPSAGFALEG